MILGGLAANSGFAAGEIERMNAAEAQFWWNAIAGFYQRVKEQAS